MATQEDGNLIPMNIFINHLDTYISSNVGKILLKSVFNKKAKIEEDNESQEEENNIVTNPPVDFKNNIFCTLSNAKSNLKYPVTIVEVRTNQFYIFLYSLTNGVTCIRKLKVANILFTI